VLVTGAAGSIGSYFAAHAGNAYDLVLTDQDASALEELSALGRCAAAELADLEAMKSLCEGVDTVVHLAACANPATPWEPLLETNIAGAYNLFAAAEACHCRRVVFASSIHAVSGYPVRRQVQPDDPISPGDLYGVSKCFGEAMGRYLATQRGLSVLCVRIGSFQPIDKARQDEALELINTFVSRRDLDQMLRRCIDDERLAFGIFHGLSDNPLNRMNTTSARELLGYEPQDSFSAENPRLAGLELNQTVQPHDEAHGQFSGMRDEL